MTTFKVNSIKSSSPELQPYLNLDRFKKSSKLFSIKEGTVEALKVNTNEQVAYHRPSDNSFVNTVLESFRGHVPLAIGPDEVWLVICQAAAKHIALNSETPEVRAALGVTWDGKKRLEVQADHLVKGSETNNWDVVWAGFSDQIANHVGKKRDLFDPTFTTTTSVEKAAIQIQLMAAMSPFFEFGCMTCSGIPEITLLGTPDDWADITRRVEAFGEFYPEWAHKPLLMVVKAFESAAGGNADQSFWQSFFRYRSMSGAAPVNGFINAFFPYVDDKPNALLFKGDFVKNLTDKNIHGTDLDSFASGIVTVPMYWNYYGKEYKMTLATGIFGTTVYDGSYRSAIGWAVGEENGEILPSNDKRR